jgi:predicted ribosomally synthesized peptide with SipW-like signal peptide
VEICRRSKIAEPLKFLSEIIIKIKNQMKRILLSLGLIAVVAVVSITATRAFFSDTETSTANVFTAGAIDLKIDNESYATNPETGEFEWSEATSWESKDLDGELFFNFDDVKPGDMGEDTISLLVNNNDAYACMNVTVTGTPENSQTEPEAKVDETNGENEGELQKALNFVFWADDGDNVFEQGENIIREGSAESIFTGQHWTLADTENNVWTQQTGPITGAQTYYVAKMWCLGDLEKTPLTQEEGGDPLTRGTGFSCSGANLGNETQTDGITADVEFYAVQSRNNGQFLCSSLDKQEEPEIVWTENGTQNGGDVAFVEDANAPIGSKVLQLTTADDVNSRVRYNHAEDVKLSTISGFSYDSKQISAFDPINGNASFRLVIDFLDDGTLVKDVTFEPYYNIAAYDSLNDASITNGTWQNWAATLADGTFWVNDVLINGNNSSGGGGYPPVNFTLNQLLAEYPNAKVVGISIGMGTYNKDQVVLVDNLIFNGIVHDFEN